MALETGIKLLHSPLFTQKLLVLHVTFPCFSVGRVCLTSLQSQVLKCAGAHVAAQGERRPIGDCGGRLSPKGWLGFDWQRRARREAVSWRPSCWWRDLFWGNTQGCTGGWPPQSPGSAPPPPSVWAGSAPGALEGPSPDSGHSSLLTVRALVLLSHESQIRWI